MEEKEEKKGWSWLGFLFNAYYFAGYGELKKAIMLIIPSVLIPIVGIGVAVYGGLKAKQELPIGEVEFNWKNVGIVLAIAIVCALVSQLIIQSLQG